MSSAAITSILHFDSRDSVPLGDLFFTCPPWLSLNGPLCLPVCLCRDILLFCILVSNLMFACFLKDNHHLSLFFSQLCIVFSFNSRTYSPQAISDFFFHVSVKYIKAWRFYCAILYLLLLIYFWLLSESYFSHWNQFSVLSQNYLSQQCNCVTHRA